jgi:hypothetical protein
MTGLPLLLSRFCRYHRQLPDPTEAKIEMDFRPKTTELPSIAQAEFTLFGVTLHCHVLSDGQRVIDANDIARLFEVMETGGPQDHDDAAMEASLEAFARWMRG